MRQFLHILARSLLGISVPYLAVGLLLSTQLSAQDAGNLYNTRVDERLGERYFQRQCSRCHGQDAKGTDETGAPNLTGRLSNANSDAGIFRIIRQGISGTAMLPISSETPDANVWQLVAFINSLRSDPSSVELAGSASSGKSLFDSKGNCADCHMVDGQGGRIGPDLSYVGERRDPEQLMSDLVDPNDAVDPRWWTIRASLRDGSVVEGLRMNEDTFTLRIMDADLELVALSKNAIESSQRIKDSTMPAYSNSMNQSELDDLVAYLFSLRHMPDTSQ